MLSVGRIDCRPRLTIMRNIVRRHSRAAGSPGTPAPTTGIGLPVAFLPLHAPGARRLERTSEQNPSLGDRGGSRGQAARPVVRTIGLV